MLKLAALCLLVWCIGFVLIDGLIAIGRALLEDVVFNVK